MVDFSKKIKNLNKDVIINPIYIYNDLDRQTTKVGPLRKSQEFVLNDWFENRIDKKDVLLKLNTGAGKTLVGLLILESRRRQENSGIEIYLCNDMNLINQTINQAKLFGINLETISENNEIPDDVIARKKILITSVQKFFNGKTIFNSQYSNIDGLVIDDAHSSSELIKQSCVMKITKSNNKQLYNNLFNLLSDGLKSQGFGDFEDLKNNVNNNLFLPVPYWTWIDKIEEVTRLLSDHSSRSNELKFVWPLLKNKLKYCDCIFSGDRIEIQPLKYPLNNYKGFINANQRIFMSATTASDSVLIKDLDIGENAIKNPLVYPDEKWSGEKMIIIPSIISDNFQRGDIVKEFGSKTNNTFGITIIVPNFYKTCDWKKYGSIIGRKENLEGILETYHKNKFSKPLVLVNRYDGIDLPDDETRILILDSLPKSVSLMDKYIESVVPNGTENKLKIAQKIEQGLGRSVRADTDYSVIIFTGPDLVSFVRDPDNQQYFSKQTLKQIQIGIEISEEAKKDINNDNYLKVLSDLIKQSLLRDEDWKEFYKEQMESLDYSENAHDNIAKISKENVILKDAVNPYVNIDKFNIFIDNFISHYCSSDEEKGWYEQIKARVNYFSSKIDSEKYQKKAYNYNNGLLLLEDSIEISKLKPLMNDERISNIINEIKSYKTYENLLNHIMDITAKLTFGTNSKEFENAMDDIGKILGFKTERPDYEYKKGPDHLWAVKDNLYFIIEDKNKVKESREKINKNEMGQMNNSIGWFNANYHQNDYHAFLVIPTKYHDPAANFNGNVTIIRKGKLNFLTTNIKNFIKEFSNIDLNSLSNDMVRSCILKHSLEIDNFIDNYSEKYV
ncbi:DEAD/DEAH box helicase family protein [Fructilactobacillus myrtifloralis]|uniref:DEAD/DEAH box helicase family protein n=1 Tax=Fructilactobacillus myrtifloralis TaxID=2940301 RepID=A0ABY5BT20_9LACO|nr:DEAD/DEAH box helicase family protein [Fructilactobacillus myrtifloralis]USS85509.1 DEAD/DEAH box helicase family protein [Fructilactobacillus myrtifloralis]